MSTSNEMPAGGFEIEIREHLSYRDIIANFLKSGEFSSPREDLLPIAYTDLILSKFLLTDVAEKGRYRLDHSILAFGYSLTGKSWPEQEEDVKKQGLIIPKALTALFITLTLQSRYNFLIGHSLYRTSSVIQFGGDFRVYLVAKNGQMLLERQSLNSWSEGRNAGCGAFAVAFENLFTESVKPIL